MDGLRALAIIPVIFNHCYPMESWPWISFLGADGWMGVDLFFVLSGYLITGILLDAKAQKHAYRNFVVRRTLRIFPLYYLCLVLFTVAIRVAEHTPWGEIRTWGSVGWFFAYVGNFYMAWMNSDPPVFSFAPLWSLQIEEQFYLLYPFAVLSLSAAHLRKLLIGCVVVAPLFRTFLLLFVPGSGEARFVLTPSRMDSLALGGLVALLLRFPQGQALTRPRVRTAALLAGAALAICAVIPPRNNSPLMDSIGSTLIGITSALILILVVQWPSDFPGRWLRWRPLVYTGQIAYGLYLLHGPAGYVARSLVGRLAGIQITGHSAASVPITYVAAFIAASLSWRFFESPILSLKDRLTRWAQPGPVPGARNAAIRPRL